VGPGNKVRTNRIYINVNIPKKSAVVPVGKHMNAAESMSWLLHHDTKVCFGFYVPYIFFAFPPTEPEFLNILKLQLKR
jgi:hypothetical protein